MARGQVSGEVPLPHQHLPAEVAAVGGAALCVEPHVLVQVAGVSERSLTHLAAQRLVACVCPDVYLEAILPGVDLAAVQADMASSAAAQV